MVFGARRSLGRETEETTLVRSVLRPAGELAAQASKWPCDPLAGELDIGQRLRQWSLWAA